jgi:DNA repair protein SbcC/Rad50
MPAWTVHEEIKNGTLAGFGALDEARREFLVKELQRLSEDVLQGGRVIVVSHQENVKEKFNHRYFLKKDERGFVQGSHGENS